MCIFFFFFSSRRRHTRFDCDWSSDVCSSDLGRGRRAVDPGAAAALDVHRAPQQQAAVLAGQACGLQPGAQPRAAVELHADRKSTRLNSSHSQISYAVFCLKKKKKTNTKNVHESAS